MKKIIFLAITLSICLNFFGCFSLLQDKLCSYDIQLTLTDSSMEVQATMNFSYYNDSENTTSELVFNLYGNVYREGAINPPVEYDEQYKAYPNGLSYGNMAFSQVTSNGEQLEFVVEGTDENILTVKLQNEIFPDERCEITIDYTLSLANINHRLGYSDDCINLSYFYPILAVRTTEGFYQCENSVFGDPFYSEVAHYNVSLTCASEYVVASSGCLKSKKEDNGATESTFVVENARDFALVLSKNFNVISQEVEGVNLSLFYLNTSLESDTFSTITQAFSYFSGRYVDYEYDSFNVVLFPSYFSSCENTALVSINESEDNVNEAIISATAHEWFGVMLGTNGMQDGYIDEGLSMFALLDFYRNNGDYGVNGEVFLATLYQNYKVFCSVNEELLTDKDTTMNRTLKGFSSEYEYSSICLVKGGLMFEQIHNSVGEELFFKGINKLFSENLFENIAIEHFIGAFERVGVDISGMVESFVLSKAII